MYENKEYSLTELLYLKVLLGIERVSTDMSIVVILSAKP